MPLTESSLLSTFLGIAATFLWISLLVQIIQEIYKFGGSSKSRAYTAALKDFVGPWATQLLQPEAFEHNFARGPFQFLRFKPGGILLPLGKDQLINSLVRTSPPWIRKSIERLELEIKFQNGSPKPPSAQFNEFLRELNEVDKDSLGYWDALEIRNWMGAWWSGSSPAAESKHLRPPTQLDAREVLIGLREKFVPHIQEVEKNHPQFEENFKYVYRRRNLRQTFIIAFFFACIFNFSVDRIYSDAKSLDPEKAAAVATQAIEYYANQEMDYVLTDSTITEQLSLAREILDNSLKSVKESEAAISYLVDWDKITEDFKSVFLYLIGCIFTAVFVSFGAPFWNDISKTLLSIQQSKRQRNVNSIKEK